MQVVRNSIILLILLPLAVMLFMPKKEIYYLVEKKLAQNSMVISGETIKEGLFSLTLEHPTLYYKGAEVATAEIITLWSIWFYSRAELHNSMITEGLPTELSITYLEGIHSLLSPMQISISGESSLGEINGTVDLKSRKIHLDIEEGGKQRAFVRYLKKGEKGWYYESTF